jgi:hypothetical protein
MKNRRQRMSEKTTIPSGQEAASLHRPSRFPTGVLIPGAAVTREVIAERVRQDAHWGQQDHPNGTGVYSMQAAAERSRRVCEQNAYNGTISWADILREEFHEALAESDPAALRAELIQVAAVAVAWVENIDRRGA